MKECLFCKAELDDDVQKCKSCGEWVNRNVPQREFGKTLTIAFFFGFLGAHRFYTGYKKIGIVQLILSITLIGALFSMIWSFIDIISICLNKYKDVYGRPLHNYDKTGGVIILIITVTCFLLNAGNAIEGWNNTSTLTTQTNNSKNTKTKVKQSKGKFEILEHSACRTEFGNPAVCGVIVNNTDNEYDYLQIEVNFYDKNGTLVDSSMDNINNFEPHSKWKFQVVPMSESYSSYKIKGVSEW